MQPKKSDRQRSFLCPDLIDQLDPRNHLLGLGKAISWQVFEDSFRPLYATSGRPAKPVRLMVGLLILKQLENLIDERVVEIWAQNPYFQAFCGQQRFTWKLPCDPSEWTYFQRRIGEDAMRKIFEVSVTLHGDKAKEEEVVVDSTVQEKNITFPTDAKLLTKIVTRRRILAKQEDVKLRRSYQREVKKLLRIIRFKSKGRKQGEAQRAIKRLRTIAGVLIREMKRKLSPEALEAHQQSLDLYDRVPRQQRSDSNKIYSLHEPGRFLRQQREAPQEVRVRSQGICDRDQDHWHNRWRLVLRRQPPSMVILSPPCSPRLRVSRAKDQLWRSATGDIAASVKSE